MRRNRARCFPPLDPAEIMHLLPYRVGDGFKRSMGPLPLSHYCVYVGLPDLPGVIHGNKPHGVHFAPIEEFEAGRRPEIADRADRGLDAALRVARAQSRNGTTYNALTRNCEHLVTYAQNGKIVSWQVRIIVAIVALVVLAALCRVLAARR